MIFSSLKKIQLYLAYLIPLLIIVGPFAADLAISLVGIIFIILVIKQKKVNLFINKYIFIFLIWNLYLIINSFLSVNPLLSLESSLFYFRFFVFALAISYIDQNYINFKKNYLLILFSILFVLFVDSLFQLNYGFNLIGLDKFHPNRISSFFNDELILGSYAVRLYPLIVALLFLTIKKDLYKLLFFIFLTMITSVLILLSGERTSLIMLLIILIMLGLFKYNLKYLNISFLFIFIFSFVFSLSVPEVRNRMYVSTYNQIFLDENTYIFSVQHHSLYLSAYKMFLDNPVSGIGPKNYRFFCDKTEYRVKLTEDFGCTTHPHNFYVQLLAETGVVGALPIILLFLYTCYVYLKYFYYSYIKNIKSDLTFYRYTLMLSLLITLWPFIPNGNFFGNYLNCIMYIPFGFLLNEMYLKNKINEK